MLWPSDVIFKPKFSLLVKAAGHANGFLWSLGSKDFTKPTNFCEEIDIFQAHFWHFCRSSSVFPLDPNKMFPWFAKRQDIFFQIISHQGLFPAESGAYDSMRTAFDRLSLNDAALFYEPENSVSWKESLWIFSVLQLIRIDQWQSAGKVEVTTDWRSDLPGGFRNGLSMRILGSFAHGGREGLNWRTVRICSPVAALENSRHGQVADRPQRHFVTLYSIEKGRCCSRVCCQLGDCQGVNTSWWDLRSLSEP